MSTPQAPIGSGFGAATTAAEVTSGLDLTGTTAVVTGGYAGIGLETTRALRSAGAEVVVPARDRRKAAAALGGLDGVRIESMDLADPASVDRFADAFLASGRPLHLLVANAGIMATPLTRDARGYESQFATNHLGHFQLAARLWPALRRAEGARVVAVSSWGHRFSRVVFEDPNFERREYDRWSAYGQSKTANILFALAADERGAEDGIRAFSLHPGFIAGTDLTRHLSTEELRAMGAVDGNGEPILDPSRNMKTPEQGAATTVWCATSPRLDGMGGVYCENCDIAPLLTPADEADRGEAAARRAGSGSFGVMPFAVDAGAARRLWELSEQLVGPGHPAAP